MNLPIHTALKFTAFAVGLVLTASAAFGQAPPGAYGPYWEPPVVKGGPMPRTPDGHPNLNGYWAGRFNRAIFDMEDQPSPRPGGQGSKGAIVDPPGGKIPYKPEAAAKAKDLGTNQIYQEPEAHCYMSGVPHTAYQQFGFQIVQTPGYFVLTYEYAHSYRIVPTDGRPHVPGDLKLFMGDSVGHWEGDTLVIDTTNQSGKTWFDMVGNFTTPNIHVVERITPADENNIAYEATVEDSTIYTRPWKIAGTWGRNQIPGYQQMEFGCDEGNQDLEHYVDNTGGAATQVRGKK